MRRGEHASGSDGPFLKRCRREGTTHVVLDGTLIETARLAGIRDNGDAPRFRKKNKAFGGRVQILTAADGAPLLVHLPTPRSRARLQSVRETGCGSPTEEINAVISGAHQTFGPRARGADPPGSAVASNQTALQRGRLASSDSLGVSTLFGCTNIA
ncbi:hypothetical protein [Streptomyces sp. NPDC007063]|uniref:hypothetical protein n=1 Tax=Streptomyces sp. NPDC007063 TaxID=3364772 RepID=UPI0036A251A7